MKKLLLVFCIIISFEYAKALTAKPIECLSQDGRKVTARPCYDFDEKAPGGKEGVCVFVKSDNTWQRGKLIVYKDKTPSQFIYQYACDQGVNVIRTAESIDYLSPSMGDYYSGKKSAVELVSGKYHSKIASNPAKSSEVPTTCYLENSNGVPYHPRTCSPNPNSADYCDFVASPNGNFTGKWWVLYRNDNKRSPDICRGGVQVSDAKEAMKEFGEDQVILKNTTLNESNIEKVFLVPDLDSKNNSDANIISCTTVDSKNHSTRHICTNEKSSGYESWVSKKSEYRDLLLVKAADTNANKIDSLRRTIYNGTKAARDKAQADLDDLLEKMNATVDKKIEALEDYPVEVTKAEEGACYINWNPTQNLGHKYDFIEGTPASAKTKSTVYIFQRAKVDGEWVLQKNKCAESEASEKVEIGTK